MERDVVTLTQQLIRIPSVNPMGRDCPRDWAGEWRVTNFLETLFQEQGLETVRQEVIPAHGGDPPRENLLVYVAGEVGRPVLWLEAHQDTVPVVGMTVDPFGGRVDSGRIYGRGACDVKGGLACCVAALLQAARLPVAVRPTVVGAFTVNEEHGFDGARYLSRQWQRSGEAWWQQLPDGIIVTEPTDLQVVTSHKGTLHWRCRVTGRAAHSSAPHSGENAIYLMARVVALLESYAQHVVPQLAADPALGRPTLSVGTIEGGSSVNTVPDLVTIQIDRRLCPGETVEQAQAHAIQYLRDHLSGDQWMRVHHDPPAVSSGGLSAAQNGWLASCLRTAATSVGQSCRDVGVPYATDAGLLAATGSSTVVFGPGSIDQAHTAAEWIDVRQLPLAVAILGEVIRQLGTLQRRTLGTCGGAD